MRSKKWLKEEKEDIDILIRVFLLEKAVYEIGYELNNRPDWVIIPLKGTESLLGGKNAG